MCFPWNPSNPWIIDIISIPWSDCNPYDSEATLRSSHRWHFHSALVYLIRGAILSPAWMANELVSGQGLQSWLWWPVSEMEHLDSSLVEDQLLIFLLAVLWRSDIWCITNMQGGWDVGCSGVSDSLPSYGWCMQWSCNGIYLGLGCNTLPLVSLPAGWSLAWAKCTEEKLLYGSWRGGNRSNTYLFE